MVKYQKDWKENVGARNVQRELFYAAIEYLNFELSHHRKGKLKQEIITLMNGSDFVDLGGVKITRLENDGLQVRLQNN